MKKIKLLVAIGLPVFMILFLLSSLAPLLKGGG